MKIIKRIFLFFLILFLALFAFGYYKISSSQPVYDGEKSLSELKEEVEVIYDSIGVPHIYAQNEEDLYYALGYVHAQERLWQMDLIRRVGAGRLAEILGPDLVETDKFFRTIGIRQKAEESAQLFMSERSEPYQKAALSYLDGINEFIHSGSKPLEYSLIGAEVETFTPADFYNIQGYMAFSFAVAHRTEPLTTMIQRKYGNQYLNDLMVHWPKEGQTIPVHLEEDTTSAIEEIAFKVYSIFNDLPVAPWIGSNSWVLSGSKTLNGKVIFANDPHIGFSQPAVWFEAHLEAPGFSFYGHHLAGIPFGVLGHTQDHAWGLTMFENDDIDLFAEKANDNGEAWVNDHWEAMTVRNEKIKIKDSEPVELKVLETRHGPIINDIVFRHHNKTFSIDQVFDEQMKTPVSLNWVYMQFDDQFAENTYNLAHAKSIEEVKRGASKIHAPGLNVMYGDKEGNIAWWAVGKLPIRPDHVNSKLILDGASGKDEYLGFYDFSKNPQAINPPEGYVYSANNQPQEVEGVLYPGYYVPEDRGKRIVELLNADNQWTVEKVQQMLMDETSSVTNDLSKELSKVISTSLSKRTEKDLIEMLSKWDGNHHSKSIEATVYNKFLYHFLQMTFEDELGEEAFHVFLSTHLMKRSIAPIILNDTTQWYDNVDTQEKESRKDILLSAFQKSISILTRQLGEDYESWTWDRVHRLKHKHAMGQRELLEKIFNVGPFSSPGANAVINNIGFTLSDDSIHYSDHGPSTRRVIDFANVNRSFGILPTGQSGHFRSPHYSDQAHLYNKGEFRMQLMDRKDVEAAKEGILLLKPGKN